jgi:hypothetical protein
MRRRRLGWQAWSWWFACALTAVVDACDDSTATNYDPESISSDDCFGVMHVLSLAFMDANGTVAGSLVEPVVELHDAAGRLVRRHAQLQVRAQYPVVAWKQPLTGAGLSLVSGGEDDGVGTSKVTLQSVTVPLVNGTANFTGTLRISYANQTTQLTFRLMTATKPSLPTSVPPLVSPPFSVVAAAPAALILLHQPDGGLFCAPFQLQPHVALKDAYNNTVLTSHAALHVSVVSSVLELVLYEPASGEEYSSGDTSSEEASGELGAEVSSGESSSGDEASSGAVETSVADGGGSILANLSAGVSEFEHLGLNGTASGIKLSFALGEAGLASPGHSTIASLTSAAFDCHGPPVRIALLPGAPLALEALDASGLRATAVHGASLLAYMQHPDGSQAAAGSAIYSVRGAWHYTHENDPLAAALAVGVSQIVFVANLTSYLGGWGLEPDRDAGNATCCELTIPRPAIEGETVSSLFTPPISIVRLVARNTGHQGGWGAGDTIEITTNIRTDRAGFEQGQIISREEVHRDHDLNSISATFT